MLSQFYFCCFWEGAILIGTSPIFLEHFFGYCSIEAPLWIPSCKIKNTFSVYITWELNFWRIIWDKTKVVIGNTLRNNLENNLGTRKTAWNFYFQNYSSSFLAFFFFCDGSIKEAHHPQTNHFECTLTTNIIGTHSIYPTFFLVGEIFVKKRNLKN